MRVANITEMLRRKYIRAFLVLFTVLAVTPAAAAEPSECRIPGLKIHWIADYCMSKVETDDEIAAGECINEEAQKAFANECLAKLHYKEMACELAISRGQRKDDLNDCLADGEFIGSTVRNGGVGG